MAGQVLAVFRYPYVYVGLKYILVRLFLRTQVGSRLLRQVFVVSEGSYLRFLQVFRSSSYFS